MDKETTKGRELYTMTAGRMHPNMLNNLTPREKSEYVIISKQESNKGGFLIAEGGGFLLSQGGEFYKCKRSVAETLELYIIADCPQVMY